MAEHLADHRCAPLGRHAGPGLEIRSALMIAQNSTRRRKNEGFGRDYNFVLPARRECTLHGLHFGMFQLSLPSQATSSNGTRRRSFWRTNYCGAQNYSDRRFIEKRGRSETCPSRSPCSKCPLSIVPIHLVVAFPLRCPAGWPPRAANSFVPSGLPRPVHGSQPVAALYPPLSPCEISFKAGSTFCE